MVFRLAQVAEVFELRCCVPPRPPAAPSASVTPTHAGLSGWRLARPNRTRCQRRQSRQRLRRTTAPPGTRLRWSSGWPSEILGRLRRENRKPSLFRERPQRPLLSASAARADPGLWGAVRSLSVLVFVVAVGAEDAPVRTLGGFTRLSVMQPSGTTTTGRETAGSAAAVLGVSATAFTLTDLHGTQTVRPGRYELHVGDYVDGAAPLLIKVGHLPSPIAPCLSRNAARLGLTAPLPAKVELQGPAVTVFERNQSAVEADHRTPAVDDGAGVAGSGAAAAQRTGPAPPRLPVVVVDCDSVSDATKLATFSNFNWHCAQIVIVKYRIGAILVGAETLQTNASFELGCCCLLRCCFQGSSCSRRTQSTRTILITQGCASTPVRAPPPHLSHHTCSIQGCTPRRTRLLCAGAAGPNVPVVASWCVLQHRTTASTNPQRWTWHPEGRDTTLYRRMEAEVEDTASTTAAGGSRRCLTEAGGSLVVGPCANATRWFAADDGPHCHPHFAIKGFAPLQAWLFTLPAEESLASCVPMALENLNMFPSSPMR